MGLSDSEGPLLVQQDHCSCGLRHPDGGSGRGHSGGSTINGFLPNANQNNPALLPLESDNFDISLEYYFSDTGYVSLGAFQKNVANFIGNSVQQINLFGIRNQTGGPSAQAALAFLQSAQCTAQNGGNACGTDDSALFTATAMLLNPGTFTDANGPHVGGLANYNGSNAQHVAFATKYDILPTANDPLYTFNVSTPVNNKDAKIHGIEVGGQYFFGESGFGIPATTMVV
jgi:outer membrane receptor protein involved in Fe transport